MIFFYNAIKDWNALPLDVKETNCKHYLKKAVKSFVSTNTTNII